MRREKLLLCRCDPAEMSTISGQCQKDSIMSAKAISSFDRIGQNKVGKVTITTPAPTQRVATHTSTTVTSTITDVVAAKKTTIIIPAAVSTCFETRWSKRVNIIAACNSGDTQDLVSGDIIDQKSE